jgi:hypothetical protein
MILARPRLEALAATAAALVVAAGAACGGDAEEAAPGDDAEAVAGEFVGEVEGTDAFIAIVTDGSELRAYVCDGHEGSWSISEWFRGELDGRGAALESTTGDARLEVDFDEVAGTASGQVEVDGESHAFTAAAAAGDEGLYAFKNQTTVRAGWVIIIPEGQESQRGAVAFEDGTIRANTALDPSTGTATIDEVGEVTAGKVTPIDVQRFFTNGWP